MWSLLFKNFKIFAYERGYTMERQKKQKNEEVESEKIIAIREDLRNQLLEQNKFGKHFEDMIEDYIYLVKLKEKLQEDIDEKGIRYIVQTGNGFKQKKPNESVVNILKVNNQMLKILQDLELKTPESKDNEESDANGLL